MARTECWRVRRLEDYEESENINKYYMPIDLGDIFEKPGGKQFILVGQPCDLMGRLDGKRDHSVSEITTSRIEKRPTAFHELRHFDSQSGEGVYVSFNKKHNDKLLDSLLFLFW